MHVLLLCREEDCQRERAGYRAALARAGAEVSLVESYRPDSTVQDLLAACRATPDLVLHPDPPGSYLPWGLASSPVPTACFQIDTYAHTQARIRWSLLFDHVVVFHPGYRDAFLAGGCASALFLPHAVRRELVPQRSAARLLDVGWVGNTELPVYSTRRRILGLLSARYSLNDWRRSYSERELFDVYSTAKIVVNAPRDDYMRDANLRAFEAMAAGALLLTPRPTELTATGFRDGVHFLGFSSDQELLSLIDKFIANERERSFIANAGREKVLSEHTYDVRAKLLIDFIAQQGRMLAAPARGWPTALVRATYLDYHASRARPRLAAAHLSAALRAGPRIAVRSTLRVGAAWARAVLSGNW